MSPDSSPKVPDRSVRSTVYQAMDGDVYWRANKALSQPVSNEAVWWALWETVRRPVVRVVGEEAQRDSR